VYAAAPSTNPRELSGTVAGYKFRTSAPDRRQSRPALVLGAGAITGATVTLARQWAVAGTTDFITSFSAVLRTSMY
jgi:hypothetical protein